MSSKTQGGVPRSQRHNDAVDKQPVAACKRSSETAATQITETVVEERLSRGPTRREETTCMTGTAVEDLRRKAGQEKKDVSYQKTVL